MPPAANQAEPAYGWLRAMIEQFGGRLNWRNTQESIALHLDHDAHDFWMDVHEKAGDADLVMVTQWMTDIGLKELGENEWEYESCSAGLPSGWSRIYYRHGEPADDLHIDTLMEVG